MATFLRFGGAFSFYCPLVLISASADLSMVVTLLSLINFYMFLFSFVVFANNKGLGAGRAGRPENLTVSWMLISCIQFPDVQCRACV
jgi:hypothetical protein